MSTSITSLTNSQNNAFAEEPDFSFSFVNVNMPATVIVGQDFTLTGKLVSDAMKTLDHVYLSIESPNQIWIYGDKTVDLGYFISGTSEKSFSFKLRSLQSGPIQITLTASGIENMKVAIKGSTVINASSLSTLTASQSTSQLSFTFVYVPPDIARGNDFDLQYSLVNKGSFSAEDVFISVESPDDMIVKGDSINYVGKFGPGEAYSSHFKLDAKKSGSYALKLTAFSSNNPPITLPVTVTISDPNIKLSPTTITTTPSFLYPGDVGDKIDVGITNYGDETLEGLTVNLLLADGITEAWSGANTYTLSYLPPAKEFPNSAQQFATFFVNIDPNIKSGTYRLTLTSMDSNFKNYTMSVPIVVLPKANFSLERISYSGTDIMGTIEPLTSVTPSKTTVVRVLLKNNGNAAAENVVVQLQANNDFEGTRSDVSFIGNTDTLGTINPGQTFSSTFFLDVDETVPAGTYQGTILITWKQGSLAGDFKKSLSMPITVTETPVTDKIPYLQIFLGGLSAVFIVLYLMSKRKKHQPELLSKTPV